VVKRTVSTVLIFIAGMFGTVSSQPAATPVEQDRIVHLLNRAAYGPRPGDVEAIMRHGIVSYIDEQLRPETVQDSALEARLGLFDTWTSEPPAIRDRYGRDPRPVLEQLLAQRIVRAIYSERQLQEVLVDFWFNHFNVNWSKDGLQFVTTAYERDVIRPHALGKFKDLLVATAKHPAMLIYLDNAMSSSKGINENYARELMELHTLGVDGGYLQNDVEEVARAFTGWTVNADGTAFEFRPDMHAPGAKVVLEHTIPSSGYGEGEAILDILAHHPSTARFIATKLVRRFVSDDPPPTLIDRGARVFMESDGDIRAMVHTILTSDEFHAPSSIRAKTKSPFETVVSAMRAVNADLEAALDSRDVQGSLRGLSSTDIVLGKFGIRSRVSPAVILTRIIQEMGQFPYQNPEPTGYPDRADYWMSSWTVLNRMRFAVSLANNEILGTKVDHLRLGSMLQGYPPSEEGWKHALAAVLAPPSTPSSPPEIPDAEAVVNAFALALGSPEFQQK
jgi:uncharacterized protein (DUF1800 family)